MRRIQLDRFDLGEYFSVCESLDYAENAATLLRNACRGHGAICATNGTCRELLSSILAVHRDKRNAVVIVFETSYSIAIKI